MSVYLDANSVLQRDAAASVLRCPHCEATGAMRVSSSPAFDDLQRNRPGRVGVVVSCGACGEPVFLRYRVRQYLPDRIDFDTAAEELERIT